MVRSFFILGLLVALASGQATAQTRDPNSPANVTTSSRTAGNSADIEAARPAAEEGLGFARDLYLDFGGDASLREIPAREVEGLRLGQPFRHYMIKLDDLKAYDVGAPINSVLTHLPKFTFPILAPSGVVGQVTVVQDGGTWEVASVGGYRRIRNTLNALQYASNADETDGELRAMVSVPALNLRYLATRYDGQAFLTRIYSRQYPAEAAFAEDVLTELSAAAQDVENLPH